MFLFLKPLPKLAVLGTLLLDASLLVEKALLERKFQKVYVNPNSDMLGAGGVTHVLRGHVPT